MSVSQKGGQRTTSASPIDDKIAAIIGEMSQKAFMPDGDSKSTTLSEEAGTTNIYST